MDIQESELGPLPDLDAFHAAARLDHEGPPAPGQLWAHKDGGLYSTEMLATDTATGGSVMVYAHVWPFNEGPTTSYYTRPLDQWTPDRFIKVREDHWADCLDLRADDQFRVLVTRRRQERKRKELEAEGGARSLFGEIKEGFKALAEQHDDGEPTSGYVNQDR